MDIESEYGKVYENLQRSVGEMELIKRQAY